MAVESASDRSYMLNVSDFGTTATYTLVGGGSSSIIGIFDNEFFEADPQGNVAYASAQPRFMVQTSTLPSGADYGDTIVISSVTYKVRIIQPDGTGMTTLVLEKQ